LADLADGLTPSGEKFQRNAPFLIRLRICFLKRVRRQRAVFNIKFERFEGAPPPMRGQAANPGDAGSWNGVNEYL
jgi:hypothetical protein